MRVNKYISQHTLLSRRKADEAIVEGRVKVNDEAPSAGQQISPSDVVKLDGRTIKTSTEDKATITILLNKPVGFVCSKNGQGSRTIYSLLPREYLNLNIAGRLDKDSSGLVILTNDGELLHELTHPSNKKDKRYIITTKQSLSDKNIEQLITGVNIGDDRPSKFESVKVINETTYEIVIQEGRNRQIRRTMSALNIAIDTLQRLEIGSYSLDTLQERKYKIL